MKPQEIFLSTLGLPLQTRTIWMVVPSSHGGNINMLTKYALAAVAIPGLVTGPDLTMLFHQPNQRAAIGDEIAH